MKNQRWERAFGLFRSVPAEAGFDLPVSSADQISMVLEVDFGRSMVEVGRHEIPIRPYAPVMVIVS